MSQENVEVVRRAFETFAAQGPQAMVDFWDPEIELWLPSGLIQAGGTYRGHAAVLDWMKEWAEAWEEIDYTPEEFTEAGDSVLVRVLYDGRGKGSKVRVEGRFWYLLKLRNGRLLSWRLYPEKAEALEAAGLSE
jgi:ketosteroid isomerase-like protein